MISTDEFRLLPNVKVELRAEDMYGSEVAKHVLSLTYNSGKGAPPVLMLVPYLSMRTSGEVDRSCRAFH